eukprot:scaffold6254_cov376-Prasinococcus_capsulatus_cf.AAC.1
MGWGGARSDGGSPRLRTPPLRARADGVDSGIAWWSLRCGGGGGVRLGMGACALLRSARSERAQPPAGSP